MPLMTQFYKILQFHCSKWLQMYSRWWNCGCLNSKEKRKLLSGVKDNIQTQNSIYNKIIGKLLVTNLLHFLPHLLMCRCWSYNKEQHQECIKTFLSSIWNKCPRHLDNEKETIFNFPNILYMVFFIWKITIVLHV